MNSLALRRAAMAAIVVGASLLGAPQVAVAAPPSSAVVVDPTSVRQGETFIVSQTIHNDRAFTVIGAKAALYAKDSSLVGIADMVTCTGTIAPCGPLGSSYRGGVGDLPSNESRTVVFTLRIKEDATPGQFTLQHQFVGDNYAFETLDGPVITVLPSSTEADLAVSLGASASGLLTSRVTYAVTVRNNGPSDASGIRLTATYPAGLVYAGSSDCTRVSGTRTVVCDVASLANGASVTKRFTTSAGLLTIGPLVASAERTQSTPTDPNAANDHATRTCNALTGLLVSC